MKYGKLNLNIIHINDTNNFKILIYFIEKNNLDENKNKKFYFYLYYYVFIII